MDKDIRELKLKLVELLNGYNMPIEAKRLILSEICREVSDVADQVIAEQLKGEKEDAESVCENQLAE